jgi:hypothetical protein
MIYLYYNNGDYNWLKAKYQNVPLCILYIIIDIIIVIQIFYYLNCLVFRHLIERDVKSGVSQPYKCEALNLVFRSHISAKR